jgi:hypothetical protein
VEEAPLARELERERERGGLARGARPGRGAQCAHEDARERRRAPRRLPAGAEPGGVVGGGRRAARLWVCDRLLLACRGVLLLRRGVLRQRVLLLLLLLLLLLRLCRLALAPRGRVVGGLLQRLAGHVAAGALEEAQQQPHGRALGEHDLARDLDLGARAAERRVAEGGRRAAGEA